MDCYGISKPRLMVPMVSISAIYHLFPILQKSHDLIFIYSPGMRDFKPVIACLQSCFRLKLRFGRIGDCRQGFDRHTGPLKSHETAARPEDHLSTVGGISKKDIIEEGNKKGGLLIAAHSFFLINYIPTSNR